MMKRFRKPTAAAAPVPIRAVTDESEAFEREPIERDAAPADEFPGDQFDPNAKRQKNFSLMLNEYEHARLQWLAKCCDDRGMRWVVRRLLRDGIAQAEGRAKAGLKVFED